MLLLYKQTTENVKYGAQKFFKCEVEALSHYITVLGSYWGIKGVIWIKELKICCCQNQKHIDNEDHTVCHTLEDLAFSNIVMKLLFLLWEFLNSNMSTPLDSCDQFVASFTHDNHFNELKSAIVLEWVYFLWTVYGNKPRRVKPHDLS